ncbi:MAG: ATP-binding cassette domain-containing protein [candidate division Zixibacteria bacterium]|nr:ATP-binding cassette domain-containing protein [candidate division Zixibacteria bacterium]
MIEFRNIDFGYDEKLVLRDVSFDIDPTESVVIMGPSGSGKSTVLRLILGLECPQRGEIRIDGRNICVMKEKDKQELRKSIGMVFQDGALFDSRTVGENVGYYLIEHTGLSWQEIERRVREMLGFVGLDASEIIDKLPEELSGGMQRRVAIGRALLSTDPKIMLYDEPTTGLDPQSTENVLTLINKLTRERSISTVVVTHQIADALGVAKRFIVIHEGEVAFDGDFVGLRDCRDDRVRNFLGPFRASMDLVAEKKFMNGV